MHLQPSLVMIRGGGVGVYALNNAISHSSLNGTGEHRNVKTSINYSGIKKATESQQCGQGLNSEESRSRQVNLVLDDSGSMFRDPYGNTLDRWSNAKYALEVFVAMLEENDSMNVYLTSSYIEGASGGPVISLTGEEPPSSRVAKIHGMHMKGGGTPYGPVSAAAQDLTGSHAQEKWLVVLSDGLFNDRDNAAVQQDFSTWVNENTNETSSFKVAFLAMGADAPTIQEDNGIIFEQALETNDLLGKVTAFANRIFARDVLPQESANAISTDIALDELTVFAQGDNVQIKQITVGEEKREPKQSVSVKWTENPTADYEGLKVTATPNKNLSGVLATFTDVPAGTGSIDVSGASEVEIFYKPHVSFGIQLIGQDGKEVAANKVVGGEYTVHYGFMDENCEFIESDLLGEVVYTAQVMLGDEIIASDFASGDQLSLERSGDAETIFKVKASYLKGNTSEATIKVKVLKPAQEGNFVGENREYDASKLNNYKIPEDAIKLSYGIKKGEGIEPFSAEEWATVTDDSIKVTSSSNVEFETRVDPKEIGTVYLLPKAPKGEPLDADTGTIPVHIDASHIFDEQENKASYDTEITINDDFSFLERLLHWFLTVGWKWLIVLLIALLILGYIVKPKFSRKIQSNPKITISSMSFGSADGAKRSGKFLKSRLSQVIPYKAETATLRYAPSGVSGFVPMQLKAQRKGRIKILNWKGLANKGNVRIGGRSFDPSAKNHPPFSTNTRITASSADGNTTYALTMTSK